MSRLFAIAVLITALVLMTSPRARAWAQAHLPMLLLYGAAAALVAMAIAGRLDWLFALIGAALAAAGRALPAVWRYAPWLAQLLGAGSGRRDAGEHAPTGKASGRMTPEEARDILGLGPEATAADIAAAHRRLMQRLHPDRGGTPGLAARLNEAREVLLARGDAA